VEGVSPGSFQVSDNSTDAYAKSEFSEGDVSFEGDE
jgi:hypothetical protein